jgi:hypothetical protein
VPSTAWPTCGSLVDPAISDAGCRDYRALFSGTSPGVGRCV